MKNLSLLMISRATVACAPLSEAEPLPAELDPSASQVSRCESVGRVQQYRVQWCLLEA
jgi:hypothetical protein